MVNRNITLHALFIAIYCLLVYLFLPISNGMIQVRVAEALLVLVLFDKYSIASITIACFLSNILMGNVFDAIFGATATFIGLVFTYVLRKNNYFIAVLPNIISNALIIPFVLKYAYGMKNTPIYMLMLFVGIGEAISIYLLGYILYRILIKKKVFENKS